MNEPDELAAHLATCAECKPDTIDADGNAELGSYCRVAMDIIIAHMTQGEYLQNLCTCAQRPRFRSGRALVFHGETR
jgi:hypothetical protein